MSLENVIVDLTNAVVRLTEVMQAMGNTPKQAATSEYQPEAKAPAPKPAGDKPKAKHAPTAAEKPKAEPKPEKQAEESGVTYDQIKEPFLALAKADMAEAQKLLAHFGIETSLKNAKPEQYADIHAYLEALASA